MRPLRQGDGWVQLLPREQRVPVAAVPRGHGDAAGRRHPQGAAGRAVREPVSSCGSAETAVTERPPRPGISRRGFVTGALGTGVAVGAGAALAGCSSARAGRAAGRRRPRSSRSRGRTKPGSPTLPIPEQGLIASFNVHAKDRAGLKSTLQELTEEIRGLMAGKPPETRDPAYPPVDSGILGEKPPADNLSIVVGVGASLFDDRFGLADRKPKELVTMPFLANDRLDPEAVARRHLDHPRGRAQRHRAVRVAAVDAPHPKRSDAAVDDRRLRPRHRRGRRRRKPRRRETCWGSRTERPTSTSTTAP